jgi:hypothetical protein
VVVAGVSSSADGAGLVEARDTSAIWATLGLASRVRMRVSAWLSLTFEVGMMVPISARPRFEVSGAQVLQGAQIVGYARLGTSFGRFP